MGWRLALLLLWLALGAAWILFDVGEWLASRSDSVWWAMLPWVLLVLLWLVVAVAYVRWRRRR